MTGQAGQKIRVGLIGSNVGYGWAPRAHLPALAEMPDIELAAVCTAHEETAAEAAAKFGVEMAFHDHREMLRHADLDAVAVLVRVPLHHRLTMDVLEAGRHVFTEWLLGANTPEAEEMAQLARSQAAHTMVGLQGRCSPELLRVRELIEEGYVGEVLSCNMAQFGSGVLSRTSDRTWQGDRALGATTLTIPFGHSIDALCMCLGEFKEVSASVTTRVAAWQETDTGGAVEVSAPDTVLVTGTLSSGAVVSATVGSVPFHAGGYRLQVYGREGTLVVTSQQAPSLGGVRIYGGRAGDPELEELPVPARHKWVPDSVPAGEPFNVAQMWGRFATAIRRGERAAPDFETAVERHRLLDAIQRASDTGQRQTV